jgi:hypothetical protein
MPPTPPQLGQICLLHENWGIFAWKPSNMTGVPKELAEHALQIIPGSKPVRQAMRCFGDEKCRAIAEEISKLLNVGFVKEVIHTKWVANPVLVPKKNTKVLRMCVDYTGLNKVCPKDPFLCLALTKSLTRQQDRSCYAS